jgi:hypothetical protein
MESDDRYGRPWEARVSCTLADEQHFGRTAERPPRPSHPVLGAVPRRHPAGVQKALQIKPMARGRIELPTPRFSVKNPAEKMWLWLQGLS